MTKKLNLDKVKRTLKESESPFSREVPKNKKTTEIKVEKPKVVRGKEQPNYKFDAKGTKGGKRSNGMLTMNKPESSSGKPEKVKTQTLKIDNVAKDYKPVKVKSPEIEHSKSPSPKNPVPFDGPAPSAKRPASTELKQSFLPGMNPNKIAKIKMDLVTIEKGGTSKVYKPVNPKKITESAGTLSLRVNGRNKMSFQAPNPKIIRKLAESYVDLGAKVELEFTPNFKGIYLNREFHRALAEAAHLHYHGVPRKDAVRKAGAVMVKALSKEYVPTLYRTKNEWIKSSVIPALNEAVKAYDRAYRKVLREYTVHVRTERGASIKDIMVNTMALNESSACKLAIDRIVTEHGVNTKVLHAYVDGKKVIRESAENSIFTKSPKFFDVLPGPLGKLTVKSKEDKIEKAKYETQKIKAPSISFYSNGKKESVKREEPSNKGGDWSKKVDTDPKAPSSKAPVKVNTTPKSTPVYEAFDPLKFMEKFSSKLSGEAGKTLRSIIDKVKGDDDLSEAESEVLDFFINASVEHKIEGDEEIVTENWGISKSDRGFVVTLDGSPVMEPFGTLHDAEKAIKVIRAEDYLNSNV